MSFIRDHNNFVDTINKLIEVKDYLKASVLLKDRLVEEPEVSVYQLFYFEVLIKLNMDKEAMFWLKKFIAKCKSQTDVYYYKGLYYFLGSNLNRSMRSLEKCFKEKIYFLKKLLNDPSFEALQETKEFKELIAPTKEFQVNEFISLKLIFSKSLIFIQDDLFMTCQKVALNILPGKVGMYDDFNNIDDVIDFYKSQTPSGGEISITPEEEFWAHCSNMQAWVENDYNTCILSRYISFPILTELSNRGFQRFQRLLKEEIIYRIKEGGIKTIRYFIADTGENYLKYLTENDLFDNLLPFDERDIVKNIASFSPLEYTITTSLGDSRRFSSLRDDSKLHFCMKNGHITELEILLEDLPISKQYYEALLQVKGLDHLEEVAMYTYSSEDTPSNKIFLKILHDFDNLHHELVT